ncbi:hypothetical protein AC578_6117 [Pseudocercospora eumusae]|uniref:Uncharacterized protein n=1 Tax=Pseudocercospora eumusae TaxID=321146 RepID=A0A139HVJ3_9PEZI|nr:hypothetical protein AC578_6117 [Pseudocercospora eumusae]
MSHSLKQKGAAQRSKHPKGTTAKQFNVKRRLYPYPDFDEPREPSESTPATYSTQQSGSWRLEQPKGTVGGNCVSGYSGYYVRLQNGKLKAAIKLYGTTCEHEGRDGVESEEEDEEDDGEKGNGGKKDGEKKGEGASTGAAGGGMTVS